MINQSSNEGNDVNSSVDDRGRTGLFALLSVAVAAGLAAWGTWGDDADHSLNEYLVVLAIIAVSAAIVFGLVVPRWHGKRAALVVGALAVVSIVAFWSGLPIVLGAAAILLGLRLRATERNPGTVALVLGCLAIAGTVIVYIMDM